MTYLKDVTLYYSCFQNQVLAAKSSFYIEDGICKDIEIIAPFLSNRCTNKLLTSILAKELDEIDKQEMNFVPEKQDQFKNHKHFVIPSVFKRFEDLMPGSKPYKDYKFK